MFCAEAKPYSCMQEVPLMFFQRGSLNRLPMEYFDGQPAPVSEAVANSLAVEVHRYIWNRSSCPRGEERR